MSGTSESRPRVDAAAKEKFIAALRGGAHRDDAAKQAGFTAEAFYYARKRDPVFRQAWLFALELSAIDARAARFAPGGVRIAPNSKRPLQARPERRRRFDDARKRIFLDHFAGTADAHAACEAAGISYSAYTAHRRKDAEFAGACDEALAVAVAALEAEAEAVRQRLEAQRNLREGLCPEGELPKEFDRVMRLLARYDRRDGRIGLRARHHGHMKRWSFDEAILALDRHLRALGARHGVIAEPILLPPPSEEK